MDISVLGIGGIIGATIVVITNIVLYQKNRKYDKAKDQLVHLYNPSKPPPVIHRPVYTKIQKLYLIHISYHT